MSEPFLSRVQAMLAASPDLAFAEVYVIDLNGVARGKRLPAAMLEKVARGKMRMPVSTVGLDIFGAEAPDIGIELGDPDGALEPLPHTLAPVLWARQPTVQLQCMMGGAELADGGPCAYDPRRVLAGVVEAGAAKGIRATMAFELEFYLIDPARPQPPSAPAGPDSPPGRAQIYDLDVLHAFDPVMESIRKAAHALGAPVETALAEFGDGQFEVNLAHVEDPLLAADHLIALKRAIRGAARAAGLDATFMPKPYGAQAGSGLHLHVSLQGDGGGLFDAGEGDAPNAAARAALEGLIRTMPEAMLAFAPHANSYRRLLPGSYAPRVAAWGLDNRGAALRMPEVRGPGARIEHRVAGADANSYLVAAAVLAGCLDGLERGGEPPPPVETEAQLGAGPALPLAWSEAERAFRESAFAARWMGADLQCVLTAMKRQERATLLARVPDSEYDAYLRTV